EDPPIRGALVQMDAEALLDVRDQVLGAVQHARDVGADADVVAPAGVRLEHRIEAGDLVHLDRRELQVFRHRIHQVTRQEAVVLLLGGAQRRDARRALPPRRELGDPMIDFLARMLGQQADLAVGRGFALGAQRSTSPKTMSWVPMTATTSAIMWPRHISSSADRCAKPGARQCSRYGLLAPSEIR